VVSFLKIFPTKLCVHYSTMHAVCSAHLILLVFYNSTDVLQTKLNQTSLFKVFLVYLTVNPFIKAFPTIIEPGSSLPSATSQLIQRSPYSEPECESTSPPSGRDVKVGAFFTLILYAVTILCLDTGIFIQLTCGPLLHLFLVRNAQSFLATFIFLFPLPTCSFLLKDLLSGFLFAKEVISTSYCGVSLPQCFLYHHLQLHS
jgi:hypothetical protein